MLLCDELVLSAKKKKNSRGLLPLREFNLLDLRAEITHRCTRIPAGTLHSTHIPLSARPRVAVIAWPKLRLPQGTLPFLSAETGPQGQG